MTNSGVERRRLLAAASLTLLTPLTMSHAAAAAPQSAMAGELCALESATAWINSPPLTAPSLRENPVPRTDSMWTIRAPAR
jgi:hypothetical protein